MVQIKEIKERALIAHITGLLNSDFADNEPHFRLLIGAGRDDCAVIDVGASELLVATTDMLHTLTDFPSGMSPWQMGWMSIAVNLSDIAAMGAKPAGIMTALGLPPKLDLEFVTALVEGMNACARRYSTRIVGGDIDRHDELTIVGSAFGLVSREHLALRKGAQTGDLVCVTGELGMAGAALDAVLNRRYADPIILKKLFQPVPRINEARALVRTGCVSSMMDISDGLALSLHDLAGAGNVGFYINSDAIPVFQPLWDIAEEDIVNEWALYSGGDFELLFTIRPDCLPEVSKAADFTVIGRVTQKDMLIERKGKTEKIEARGFQQFGENI